MFFNNKKSFKRNYLVVYVSNYAERLYKNNEYMIYDELNQLHQERKVYSDDFYAAIRHLRDEIADGVFDYVGKEYQEFSAKKVAMMDKLYDENYKDINKSGPTVDIYYSVVSSIVKNDSDEFNLIKAGEENPQNPESMTEDELIGVMIARLNSKERQTIQTSVDLLVEDGILQKLDEQGMD